MLRKVLNPEFVEKICQPKDLFHHFEKGFTPSGYPKTFPIEFANYVKENDLDMGLTLCTGSSIGANVGNLWAETGIQKFRYAYQARPSLKQNLNSGEAGFMDTHLSNYAHQLNYGFLSADRKNKIDVGIIEASEITEDGHVILAGAVGIVPQIVQQAEKLIIEVNTLLPSFNGLHDIVYDIPPPFSPAYSVSCADERIGEPFVRVDIDKVIGVIEGKIPDDPQVLSPPSDDHEMIAKHIIEFFRDEIENGRLPENLLPLQSGVGSICNAVVNGLKDSDFENLTVWTEVIQDTTLDLIRMGKIIKATGCGLCLTSEGNESLYKDFDFFKDKIVLRPLFMSNGCAQIRRLGCIAMNTPIEVDIYGHANSSHVMGSKIVNGIGGSGDFLRNSYLSIVHTPSVRGKENNISAIVPRCTHIDHTEHDIHVIVTEQGLADLRGLEPVERARKIIDKCVHPDYKEQLSSYLDFAIHECKIRGMCHEPILLDRVFKMYDSFDEFGTMQFSSWEK